MTRRRVLLLLAPMGTLAAHGFAYGPLTGSQHADGGFHGYLPLVATVTVGAGIATLLWLAVFRHGRAVELPSVGALAAIQLGVFVGQELLERVATHVSPTDVATHPAVRWGLALQFCTAVTCVLVARLMRGAVIALLDAIRRPLHTFPMPAARMGQRSFERTFVVRGWRRPSRAPPVVMT